MEKMCININKTSMVRAAEELPNQHLRVSNMDLLLQRNIHLLLYIYESKDNNSFDTNVLKEALSKVLAQFYPVAGRLGRDNNGRLEINCNGDGVLFIEAETDSTIQQLGDLLFNEDILQLIPKVDYFNMDTPISSFPLFVLQVTKFKCGGLSLGMRWHHILSDGNAFIHFAKTWFEVARGLPITHSPFIDRSILCNQVRGTPKFQPLEANMFPPNDKLPTQNHTDTKIFKITLEQLDALKSKVQGETKYTSFEVLTAYIWRCTSKARGLSNAQETKLVVAVDGRSRLEPPLPSGYFGNVMFWACPVASCGEMVSESLKETAKRIRKAITRMDDEFLRSTMDYIDGLDDITPLMKGPHVSRCPNLGITSWMRIPFYSLDFGMGKPIFFRPVNPPEGKGYILQTPSNEIDGSWALIITLEAHHMESFKTLFYTDMPRGPSSYYSSKI